MKKKKLIVMLLIFLMILSCRTIEPIDVVRLPAVPLKPVLSGDPVEDKVILVLVYYRMLLWSFNVKYMVGEITQEEYEEKKETILNIISKIESAISQQQVNH